MNLHDIKPRITDEEKIARAIERSNGLQRGTWEARRVRHLWQARDRHADSDWVPLPPETAQYWLDYYHRNIDPV